MCCFLAHGFVYSSEVENQADYLYSADDLIVLEVEVKGSAEPFQVLLEPYALIIPGENYIGVNVKKDFKVGCILLLAQPCRGGVEL